MEKDKILTGKQLEQEKEKTKKLGLKDITAYGVMDGFGLRYITPYAWELGKSNPNVNTYVGLLTSIPSLLGSLSQLLTIKAMNGYSRKKIVFWGVFLQALMWIPLIIIGALFYYKSINSSIALSSLVLMYTLLIIFGSFAGPAWNSWMKEIITKDIGEYFGKRSRIAGFLALVGLLIAGFVLDYFEKTPVIWGIKFPIFMGFIILFTVSFIARVISAFIVLKQYEPQFKPEKKAYFSLLQFVKKMAYNNYGKFTIYYSLIYFAVTISSPFFAVYMLKDLGFSYIQYMAIIISSAITSFIFMSGWGKFSDRYGSLKVMKLCGYIIPVIPFLWLISPIIMKYNPSMIVPYLFVLEALAGFTWAGFNLAATNFIYDTVTKEKMALCVSYLSIISGIGVFIGPILGGLLASNLPALFGLSTLLIVFFISGIVRFAVSFYMLPKIKEVREVDHINLKQVGKKLWAMSARDIIKYLELDVGFNRKDI